MLIDAIVSVRCSNRFKPYLMKHINKQEQQSGRKKSMLLALFILLFVVNGSAQYNVTEIITDYNGYWKTSASSINAVKPDNSHNLLSFSYNGNRYSTGVNDLLLATKLQSFIPGDYRALPVHSINSTVNSNTKIGLGSMYDGIATGASNPAPANIARSVLREDDANPSSSAPAATPPPGSGRWQAGRRPGCPCRRCAGRARRRPGW